MQHNSLENTRNSFHRANILFLDNNNNETKEKHFKESHQNLKMLKCTKKWFLAEAPW